jgi:putative transcriptional regulator
MEKFSNNFLLSMPNLNDSVFGESLIYICDHNKSGAMGIIINKPMPEKNIKNILKETSLEQLKPKIKIYFGGPVDLGVGMFLHSHGYKTKGTINISRSIENGHWLLVPTIDDLIFNTPDAEILSKLQSIVDIDINNFSGGLSGLS